MPLVKGYQAAGQVQRASWEFCLSALSAVHLYVLHVSGRRSRVGGRYMETAGVLMIGLNPSWKTEPASYSTTFSLYDVRSPHLAMSDLSQHLSHKKRRNDFAI